MALLAGAGAVAGVAIAWASLDRLAAHVYGLQRPRLERQLGRVMGHPLQLGAYAGLRPWGLQVGTSRFLPGVDNPSTLAARSVILGLDPLRSLLQRAWVLRIDVQRAELALRPNSRGSYWELGRFKPGQEPPRLGLQIRLVEPAAIRLLRPEQPVQAFGLRGGAELQLWRRALTLQARLSPAEGGQLRVRGAFNWRQRSLALQLQPHRLPLQSTLALLPQGLQRQLQGRVQGLWQGHLQVQRRPGVTGCQGQVQLRQWRWRLPGLAQPLTGAPLALRCNATGIALDPASLRLAGWTGRLQGDLRLASGGTGRPGGWLRLQLQARQSAAGAAARGQLQARLTGPWRRPDLNLDARLQGLRLQALLAIRSRPVLQVQVPRLSLRHGDAQLQASGSLWPQLELRSRALQMAPQLQPRLRPLLGSQPQLQAVLRQQGPWSRLRLQLDLAQANNPLLGPLSARLLWRPGLLELQRLESDRLSASGQLPLGRRPGALTLRLDLRRFPLSRLSSVVGARLRGDLDAWGQLNGPLQALHPDLQLLVREPGVGPLWLRESWRGWLRGQLGAGASLNLQPLAPAPAGQLQAQLDRRWMPSRVRLERGGGVLAFSGSPRQYGWSSARFPLAGLQLALGPRSVFRPLQGDLSGRGDLALQPLAIRGAVRVERPQLLGVYGRSLSASGSLRGRRAELNARWWDGLDASVNLRLRAQPNGAFWSRSEARRLGSETLRQLLQAWPLWNGAILPAGGDAADLGVLQSGTLGASLSQQLVALQQARLRLAQSLQQQPMPQAGFDPAFLEGVVDADLTLVGGRRDQLYLDLSSRGHLWLRGDDRDLALSEQPVLARLRGPLAQGGSFSIQNLPLALLALFAPVPEGLRGGLAVQGRFALAGARRRPELELELALQDAGLQDQPLRLERGRIVLQGETLRLDWALRSGMASNSIDLKGVIPLRPDADGLELRVASRGDGLRFLSVLGGAGLQWREGSADLQLLVRGSRDEPVANGFLRFSDGQLQLGGQTISDLNAVVLFDFTELEVQQLSARVGQRGQISGSGLLGLVRAIPPTPRQLRLSLVQVPIKLSRLQTQADGELTVAGSMRRPELSGELQLSRGSIDIRPGQLATAAEPSQAVTVRQLAESNWDFRQPLLVMGQQLESATSQDLRRSLPQLSFLQLNGLRLRLGPNLRIAVPNVLNFNTGGLLTLRGPLDPNLKVSGVVRLLSGRIGLFTTAFRLDPDAANVAVFTPSLGLIPYVDIALRTTVADSQSGSPLNPSPIYDWNNTNATNSFEQLRLVKVRLAASGPADRLMDNIRLTSTPPLPQERLVALIGGNSLVGLLGANASAALATVLGQSLLNPVVGGLSDAFGQRLSFALYPTYFVQADVAPGSGTSRQLPSKLVLGSEIGLDLNERFNFSVLAAPNRSDIPPQLNLRYQASDRIGVQGSIDTEGRWQSQLQLFLRF